MKGKHCILTETGHKGKIIYEMNNYDPPQWGIQWESGARSKEASKLIREIGIPLFWQDKELIQITD